MKISDIWANKQRLIKYAVITVGVLAAVAVAGVAATVATSTPDFCATCHVMKPEYVTWQASAHSRVSCVQCHVQPGLGNALIHKVEASKELYKYVTKTYELPIMMTEQIDNDRCLKCHNLKRRITATGDLVIPHKKHQDQKISCLKCHQGVAHGQIASRGVTQGGDFKKWDAAKGRKMMTVDFTSPKMNLCMDCHERRGVTMACEACHSNPKMPDNHREKGFVAKGLHGGLAKKSISYCETCHNYITKNGGTSDELKAEEEDPVTAFLNRVTQSDGAKSINGVADFARNNSYCTDCHKKRPPSHNDEWPYKHGPIAEATPDGVNDCLVCHAPRANVSSGASVKQAACGGCHPSIHKNKKFRDSHPVFIPPKFPILEARCFTCHVKDLCGSCHMSGNDTKTKPATTGAGAGNPAPPPPAPINANTSSPGSSNSGANKPSPATSSPAAKVTINVNPGSGGR